jgi:hypothetical protein
VSSSPGSESQGCASSHRLEAVATGVPWTATEGLYSLTHDAAAWDNGGMRTKDTCPQCGHDLYKHTGVIEEPYISATTGDIIRKARPGVYYLCEYCEYGVEVGTS